MIHLYIGRSKFSGGRREIYVSGDIWYDWANSTEILQSIVYTPFKKIESNYFCWEKCFIKGKKGLSRESDFKSMYKYSFQNSWVELQMLATFSSLVVLTRR